MPYISLNDCKLYFEIYGSELDLSSDTLKNKPTIICLHGGTGQFDHTYEVMFFRQLQDFAQVVFLDYRGLGRSQRSRQDLWHPKQWAKDVYDFTNALGIEKPFLAGDSVGGHVAMLAGSQFKNAFSGLILMNTEVNLDREEIIDAFKQKGGNEAGDIAKRVLYNPQPEDIPLYMEKCIPLCTKKVVPGEMFKHCTIVNEECLTQYNQNILYAMDLAEDVKKIETPTLFLASTDNPFHNLAAAKRSIDAFNPQAIESHIIEDTGLLQVDAPETLQNHIERFITKVRTQQEENQTQYPDEWVQGMLKTDNQMGVTTLELAPPAIDFVDYANFCDKPILDIGCGYGVSSLAALKTGAKVIALDLSQSHLDVLTSNTPDKLKGNLQTKVVSFPGDVVFEKNSLSAVHATMIFHFLTPDEITKGFGLIFDWLEPGGKLFLGNMSPYLGLYDWHALSKAYDDNLKAKEQYPGFIEQTLYAKGQWKQQLPTYAHFFKIDSVVSFVTKAGFEVEKVYYYSLDNIPDDYKTNGKEYVGLTAIKT